MTKFGALKFGALALTVSAAVPAAYHFAYGQPSTSGANAASTISTPIADPNIFVKLAKRAVPSVVNISTLSTVKSPQGYGTPDDMFRRFFEEFFRNHNGRGGGGEGDEDDDTPPPAPKRPGGPGSPGGPNGPSAKAPKSMSLGSGFIIDSSGLILTNNHVVADADEIKIYFTEEEDEKPTDGTVVGRDPEIDVALIRVKTKRELTPLVLGDSESVEVGEYVMAVGNPFGQGHSVTHGIISAKGRPAPDFPLARYLQTDAPINPGNSGGPLMNLKGEVIGINNAIEARAQGIGFAIPISLVKSVLTQLKTKGVVARGFIGVLVEPLTPEIAAKLGVSKDLRAPFVSQVNPGSPAEKAGLENYDVILDFNGKQIRNGEDLVAAVTASTVGATVPVKVSRNGKEQTLQIKIAQRPGAEELARGEPGKPKKKKDQKAKPSVDTGMELETVTSDIAKELGIPDNLKGVVVSNVAYGSAADKAGLVRGDIIVEVDRKPVKNVDDFYSVVKEKKSYLVRVRRNDTQGRELYNVVILDLK
jgi:serine protease Do